MAGPISLRQWNRTLLQRQHLLERVDEDVLDVLDRCVGLQSQDPKVAFFGLWSRIADFDPADLDELMTGREVVRMALLRSTVFLMDAEDARWVRPLAQASHGRRDAEQPRQASGRRRSRRGGPVRTGVAQRHRAFREGPRCRVWARRWPDAVAGVAGDRGPLPGAAGPGAAARVRGRVRPRPPTASTTTGVGPASRR